MTSWIRAETKNEGGLRPANVTMMAWVKNSFSPLQSYVISQGAHQCIAASYALYTGVGNNLTFYIWDGTQLLFSPSAGPELWDGNWHFVAGSYDGTEVRLYDLGFPGQIDEVRVFNRALSAEIHSIFSSTP